MRHLELFGLKEEPFSTSPDPDFTFRIPGRTECLNLIEIAVRLRRGLSVVMGEVGTGKTTLGRQLVRTLSQDDAFVVRLLLDPQFGTTHELLRVLHGLLCGYEPSVSISEWRLKENVKNALYNLAVEQNKIVVLFVDEGQKIRDDCLEVLRELLNFETNAFKLLQIVILAQLEFQETLDRFHNLKDRIDNVYTLRPMTFLQTRSMIRSRLEEAKAQDKAPELFSWPGYLALYLSTRGYPRKVISLCHKVHLKLILTGRQRAGWWMVHQAAGVPVRVWKTALSGTFAAGALAALVAVCHGPAGTYATQLMERIRQGIRTEQTLQAVDPDGTIAKASAVSPPALPPTAEAVAAVRPAANPVLAGALLVHAAADDAGKRAVEPTGDLARAHTLPPELGSIVIRDKEMLSRTISKVYGQYRESYLKLILASNPEIKDPGRVASGTRIRIPRIADVPAGTLRHGFWVHLGDCTTLEEAHALLNSKAFSRTAVRLLPHFNPRSGLQFAMVLDRVYNDETEAAASLRKLPDELQNRASLRDAWDKDTVFITTPEAWSQKAKKKSLVTAQRG